MNLSYTGHRGFVGVRKKRRRVASGNRKWRGARKTHEQCGSWPPAWHCGHLAHPRHRAGLVLEREQQTPVLRHSLGFVPKFCPCIDPVQPFQ